MQFIALPRRAHDLTGRLFGRLVALGPVEIRRYTGVTHVIWRCRCECGTETDVAAGRLRTGTTKSCGCRRREVSAAVNTKHGHSKSKTGKASKEYRAWCHMIGRCHNPADKSYPRYGGRGTSVCDEWRTDFAAFLAHIGPAPSPQHSVDRIENDRGYEPGNVRWATAYVQVHNRGAAVARRKNVAELRQRGVDLKLCSECRHEKPLDEFDVNKRSGGLLKRCRQCDTRAKVSYAKWAAKARRRIRARVIPI